MDGKHYPSRREVRVVQHVPTVGFESGRDGHPSFVYEHTVSGFSPEAVQAAADVLAIDSLASWDEIAAAALAAAWATDFGGDE